MLNFKVVMPALFCFLLGQAYAQKFEGTAAWNRIPGAQSLWLNEQNQSVKFVRLKADEITINQQQNWLNTYIKPHGETNELRLVKTQRDQQGNQHQRYQQYYKGVPVSFGVCYLHLKGNALQALNGELYPEINLDVQPMISADDAFEKALQYVPAEDYQFKDVNGNPIPGEAIALEVFVRKGEARLVWKVDVYALKPLRRAWLYIDAQNGEEVFANERIHHTDVTGTAITGYNGTVNFTTDQVNATTFRLNALKGFGGIHTYNMKNGTNYGAATEFTDNDNNWDFPDLNKYALDAHYGAESTFEYYNSKFGRNSWDDQGAEINSYVHYDVNFFNAFWDGQQMTYGDGDGTFNLPLTCIDVVGHEITHAVTETSAGLVYADESGGLNEAYSDCFGVAIDFFRHPATANFLMADQANINGEPFRSMSDPKAFQNPDTYNGEYWYAPNEVHNNSGVMNHWFYLLSVGGSGINDIGKNYNVTGIGIDKAAAVAYRSLTVYLTPNSDYQDARFYAILSAQDLYGACSQEVEQVTNAWYAVGLGKPYSPFTEADFVADIRTACSAPVSVQFQNLSNNADTYAWDFGDGSTSTLESPLHVYQSPGIYSVELKASSASCNSADTLKKVAYIEIEDGFGPVEAVCKPQTASYCCGVGITNFKFSTIDHASPNAEEGYVDNTCTELALVGLNTTVPVEVITGTQFDEDVLLYIDFNNDGDFSPSEMVFSSYGVIGTHTGSVFIPPSAITNTNLRMRVMDDYPDNIFSACDNPYLGQAEDYTIMIIPDSPLPLAEFKADRRTIGVGETVNYTDLSFNNPTSWNWTMHGAVPETSNFQHPSAVYYNPGFYTTSLQVANANGSDTETKLAYIEVLQSYRICADSVSHQQDGILFDSGGPGGDYQSNENCTFIIAPDCKGTIELDVLEFKTFNPIDKLLIRDGNNTLLATLAGEVAPQQIISQDGVMKLTFTSSAQNNDIGFKMRWTTNSEPIDALNWTYSADELRVSIQSGTLAANAVVEWDMGDGTMIEELNPNHTYAQAGCYPVSVRLTDTLTNCSAVFAQEICVSENNMEGVLLYPNPGSGKFILKSAYTINDLEVVDVRGRKVHPILIQLDSETIELDLSQLSEATYLIRASSDVFKLIKVAK